MPAQHPPQPTACLLHADIHHMDTTCWDACLDWYSAHQHLSPDQARDAYQDEVERRMLDQFIREHHGHPANP